MVRPYWAFLFSVVLFGTLNTNAAILTRFQFLGPYFNFYDALFILGFLAILFDSESSPWLIPRPVEWISLIIIIGTLQILLHHDINYLVLRAIRWSINFPLAFFIGANALCKPERAKSFLFAIIIGAVLNAVVSFIDYKGFAMLHPADPAIRMPGAGNLLGISLLVAASQQVFFPTEKLTLKMAWGAALILLALTVLFGQWRSVFLGVVISIILLPVILRRWEGFIRAMVLIIIGVPVLLATLHFTLPSISVSRLVQRFTLITRYLKLDKDIPKEDMTRWRQIQRDLEEWSKGNWLIGRGFGISAYLPDSGDPNVAWGHVGYTSYLVQFGLFGLIIFALYLPLQMLRAGKEVYFATRAGPVTNLGLLTIVTVVLISVICCMSTSYLSATMHSTGFLYGGTWSLAYGNAALAKIPQAAPESPAPAG